MNRRQEEGVVSFDGARRGYRDRRATLECPKCSSSDNTLASYQLGGFSNDVKKAATWLDTPVALVPSDAKPGPAKHTGQVCGDCGHRWDPAKWERNPLRVKESKTPRADALIRAALDERAD